ncbi:MAG: hypothetical protein IJ514_05020, partial [Clostridia bacterium]|nr:hypothetical protein [Clostridia bacterium]
GFDLSTGAITAKSYNSSLSAETVTTVYTLTADDGLASYASGYTVSVRYADVTENDVTGNELAAAFATAQANAGIDTSRTDTTFATISATVNGNTFNERYKEYNATLGKYNGSLCYDEGVGTAYEREAQMLVYSVNGQSVSVVDNGKTDVKASSLITVDDKLTATDNQTNALDNKNGLLISSEGKASGDTAEGASFSFNDTMNGAFDMDFRVTSEKTYASKVTTWGAHGLANNNSYFSDIANPYADVREVAFTFTSATDSSKAFTVYLSSGFLAPTNTAGTYFTYYPYYVSARVEINGDSYKYYDADGVERGGYGLAYNDYQAGLYEYQYNYTSLWNTSFSNYAVTKSGDWAYPTPHASNIYFDPATMKVYASGADMSGGLYTDRSATKDYLVRDLTNNDAVDWGKNVYWKQVWKTLSPEDFAGGYTVSVQFTSVTSDETVAQASTAETDIPELLYDHTNGYVAFDEAYARNINMTIYSLNGTSFGTTGSKLADSEAPNLDAPKNMTAFVENDLTPLYYDVMDGNTIPEAGYGRVYVSTDDKASWTEVTVNSEGKYLYTPSVAVGTYYVKYEGFADSNGNAAETQEYAVAGVYSGFNMVNGAGIRLDTSNAGLRFTATMDKSVYEGLAAAGISDVKLFFAITVTYDKDGVETTKTLNKEVSADNVYENGTVMQITAAVTGITSDMYDYEWSAKAYITFTKDGESGTLYAKADDNVRTVRNVALAGLVDHADDTYGVEYSEEHLAILNTLAGLA